MHYAIRTACYRKQSCPKTWDLQCQTPRFSWKTTISSPDVNVRPHTFLPSLQHQAPTMWDPTVFLRDYNIRPRQCRAPQFPCDTTISGPDNVRPLAFRARLQYQAPTMPDPNNIRPRHCQIPRFSCETTILGPDNVSPHAFRARIQYQAPTMSDPTLFVRDYNIRPRQCQAPHFLYETTYFSRDQTYSNFESIEVYWIDFLSEKDTPCEQQWNHKMGHECQFVGGWRYLVFSLLSRKEKLTDNRD